MAVDELAGVDEAGRGALAGPVVAAAVILGPDHGIEGLNDSKKLGASRRERLYEQITSGARAWAIAELAHDEIDRINILQASLRAMAMAVPELDPAPTLCLVDGNRVPPMDRPARAVIGGDAIHAEIMAASILAKVHRDRRMQGLDTEYPGYGFARNKGYPTAAHRHALSTRGPSPVHRLSYAPVAQCVLALEAP